MVDSATCVTRFGEVVMIEYLSPAVFAAVLRVSSAPVFSARLATASPLELRDVSGSSARAGQCGANTREGTQRV
jgi:hypothetical protein